MADCARVLGQGACGRDATAQVRELARLADGHITVGTNLLPAYSSITLHGFRANDISKCQGVFWWNSQTAIRVSMPVAGFKRALHIDPTNRRNARAEPASAFLRRLSPHCRFASDGQKAALHAVMTMPPGATLIAALPTGWGKSALFQVGARRWRETNPSACVVVIVPTVALAPGPCP